jgi:hypothetical protein
MEPFGNGAGHPYEQTGGGMVQADVWDCQPDCPVRLLDEQSGILASGMMGVDQMRKKSLGKGGYHDGFGATLTLTGTPGDTGTASRFFPQFACLDDALAWLGRLIGVVPGHDVEDKDREVP